MENIWDKLSNELAEVTAAAGKSVVAVHGTRHPSSGIVIGRTQLSPPATRSVAMMRSR